MFRDLRFLCATLLILAMGFFSPTHVAATEQIADVLIYESTEYEIRSTPLAQLFSKQQIDAILSIDSWCSASWRGYKAYWRIEGDVLLLTGLEVDPCDASTPVSARGFFPGQSYPIQADWFSGDIQAPTGKTWGTEEELSDGTITISGYGVELRTFVVANGVLTDSYVERAEW